MIRQADAGSPSQTSGFGLAAIVSGEFHVRPTSQDDRAGCSARFLSVSRWPSSSRTARTVADLLVCVSSATCFRNTGAASGEPSSDDVTTGDPAAPPGRCARARHRSGADSVAARAGFHRGRRPRGGSAPADVRAVPASGADRARRHGRDLPGLRHLPWPRRRPQTTARGVGGRPGVPGPFPRRSRPRRPAARTPRHPHPRFRGDRRPALHRHASGRRSRPGHRPGLWPTAAAPGRRHRHAGRLRPGCRARRRPGSPRHQARQHPHHRPRTRWRRRRLRLCGRLRHRPRGRRQRFRVAHLHRHHGRLARLHRTRTVRPRPRRPARRYLRAGLRPLSKP